MDGVIVAAATYLIWVMVAGFVAVWLFDENRRGKLALGASAVAGLVIVLVLIEVAGASYYDPRPFVVDGVTALIPHAPDNGFPSDHASAAGLMAAVVALRHRWWGALMAAAAVIVAWARVAAGVHHLLDVAVGLGLGVVAAVLGTVLAWLVLGRTRLLDWPPLARLVGSDYSR